MEILGDLLAFFIQWPPNFYETWHNDWCQKGNKSTTCWERSDRDPDLNPEPVLVDILSLAEVCAQSSGFIVIMMRWDETVKESVKVVSVMCKFCLINNQRSLTVAVSCPASCWKLPACVVITHTVHSNHLATVSTSHHCCVKILGRLGVITMWWWWLWWWRWWWWWWW